jgi:hypothetical protein
MKHFFYIFTVLFIILSCKKELKLNEIVSVNSTRIIQDSIIEKPNSFALKLSNAAISIIDDKIVYTPSYVAIKYPNGDVPAKTGVCTDVLIRAFRKIGIDLQKEVHEDMKANFSKYPTKWGLKKTDTNIDHRRVPNLEVFFERKGEKLKVTQNASDYKTGDLVTWMINGKLPHIGIVTHLKSNPYASGGKRNLIVHNVGSGQVLLDCLFNYEIVGHYRYEIEE